MRPSISRHYFYLNGSRRVRRNIFGGSKRKSLQALLIYVAAPLKRSWIDSESNSTPVASFLSFSLSIVSTDVFPRCVKRQNNSSN